MPEPYKPLPHQGEALKDILSHSKRWHHMCTLLEEYVKEFGTLPSRDTRYKDMNIGMWLGTQKQVYNGAGDGTLTHPQIDRLTAIDENILENKHEIHRNYMCSLLEEYVKEFGKLPTTTAQYKNAPIGEWLIRQKMIYNGTAKGAPLTQSQIDRLTAIDENIFKNTFEFRWNFMCTLLEEYVKEFGKLPPSTAQYKDEPIGAWLRTQKSIYNGTLKGGTLTQPQIDRLTAIDENILENKNEVRWNFMCSLLEEYVKEFWQLPNQTAQYKNESIGTWLNTQKQIYNGTLKGGTLTQPQIDRLTAIDENILENKNEVRWNFMCSLLEEYVKEFWQLPKQRAKYKDKPIGAWLDTQKQIYKHGTLTQSQIDRLTVIDENIFKSQEEYNAERWNYRCTLLEEYVKEFGKLPPSTAQYKNESIGTWLYTQKSVYNGTRNGTLTQPQIDRLTAIDPTIFQNQTHASGISDFLSANTPNSKQGLGQ